MKPRYLLALPVLLALFAVETSTAFAAGYELSSPGARALGRGGAEYAGTDSPMALYFNPANLGRIDRYRLLGAVGVVFSNTCMRRELVPNPNAPSYRPGVEAAPSNITTIDGRSFLPQVCNSARPSLIPQLAVTLPVVDGLTIGLGLLVPTSNQLLKFGNVTEGRVTNSAGNSVPTPVRYLLTQQNVVQFFPTIGIGYAPIDQFRVGFAFGSGVTIADFTNYAFALGVDARNDLHAVDAFVPRITASIASTPVRGLDVSFTYSWTGDVNTDSADLDVAATLAGAQVTQSVHGVGLNAPQTWNTALAIRYAQALAGGPVDDIGDRLSKEQWDIELDFLVWGNKRVDQYFVDLPDDATILNGLAELPDSLPIVHNWRNQYIVRLGGDYNVMPGHLAVRGGFSYESDGVKDGFEQLDFTPFQRFGIHAGITGRVGRLDLSIGYTHLFMQSIDNVGSACVGDPATFPDDARCLLRPLGSQEPASSDPAISNAGRITTSYNILALEAAYTF